MAGSGGDRCAANSQAVSGQTVEHLLRPAAAPHQHLADARGHDEIADGSARDRGAPVDRIVAVLLGLLVLERETLAVGLGGPGKFVVVGQSGNFDQRKESIRLRIAGPTQLDLLAAVVEHAGVRPHNRHAGRHAVGRAEGGLVDRHDQRQPAGRHDNALWERKTDARRERPVGHVDRRVGDVQQLDELDSAFSGIVHDFIKHDRADPRIAVRLALAGTDHGDEIGQAVALDVKSEGDFPLGAGEVDLLAIAGRLAVEGVARIGIFLEQQFELCVVSDDAATQVTSLPGRELHQVAVLKQLAEPDKCGGAGSRYRQAPARSERHRVDVFGGVAAGTAADHKDRLRQESPHAAVAQQPGRQIARRTGHDLDQIAVVVEYPVDRHRAVRRDDVALDLSGVFKNMHRVDVGPAGEQVLGDQPRCDTGCRVESHQIAVAEGKLTDTGRSSGRQNQIAVRENADCVDVFARGEQAGRVAEDRLAKDQRSDAGGCIELDQIAVAETQGARAQDGAGGRREDDAVLVDHVDRVDIFANPRRINRGEPQGVTQFAQSESAGIAQRVFEQRIDAETAAAKLVERNVTATGNDRAVGNAELAQITARVAQIPTAQIDRLSGRVEQLDPVTGHAVVGVR